MVLMSMILGTALTGQYVISGPPTVVRTQRLVAQPPVLQTRTVEVQELVAQPPTVVTEEVEVPGVRYSLTPVPMAPLYDGPPVFGTYFPAYSVGPFNSYPLVGPSRRGWGPRTDYKYRERVRYR